MESIFISWHRKFLTPKLFLKLYTDDHAGRVSANSVFNYIMKRTWYQQTRVGLSIYDDNGRGYITDKVTFKYRHFVIIGRITLASDVRKRIPWVKSISTMIGLLTNPAIFCWQNLECYIQELIPTLPRLNGMDPTFLPFYTGTAVRKFFFFLDPYHTGRIKILDILSCGFIDDFLDVSMYVCGRRRKRFKSCIISNNNITYMVLTKQKFIYFYK